MQAVRNIDFSYFINLTSNSSTLRPLDLDVQPTFYQFPSIIEREHMPDWSMLVLLSCFHGRQKCRQFVLYLRTSKVQFKISLFKENTLVCPLWKSQIWNPPCPRNSSSKNPHAFGIPVQRTPPPPPPCLQNSEKPSIGGYGYFLESPIIDWSSIGFASFFGYFSLQKRFINFAAAQLC